MVHCKDAGGGKFDSTFSDWEACMGDTLSVCFVQGQKLMSIVVNYTSYDVDLICV